jgi:hypothetical protein
VKAAADAAERRSKGIVETEPKVPIDPPKPETAPGKLPTVYPIKSPGRPPKYKAEYARRAEAMCKIGATDVELAAEFGVTTWTIWHWQAKHKPFSKALRVAKSAFDDRVERSMAQRAVGYSHHATKILQYEGQPIIVEYIEHLPPDVGAGKLWLTNRRPDKWRDKVDIDHSGIVQVQEVRRVIVRATASQGR